jgi:hypothetical protein
MIIVMSALTTNTCPRILVLDLRVVMFWCWATEVV